MARPSLADIQRITPKSKRLTSAGAIWTPITCSDHEVSGFEIDCPACLDTAANTIEHMRQTGVTFP